MIATAPPQCKLCDCNLGTRHPLGSCKLLEGTGCLDPISVPPAPSTVSASGQESNPAEQHQARDKLAISWGGLPTAKIRWQRSLASGRRLELYKTFENVQYHSEANRVQRDSRNRKEENRKEEELP